MTAAAVGMLLVFAGCSDEPSNAEQAVESAMPGKDFRSPPEPPSPPVAWSQPGAELVFSSDRDGKSRIFRSRGGADSLWIDLSGENVTDSAPAWSPDGTRIAFQRLIRVQRGPEWFQNRYDIFIMNADGSGLTQLTTQRNDDSHPVWSPDGTQIAFVSWRQEARDSVLVDRCVPKPEHHIYVMDANGGDMRRLLKEGMITGFSWAPDGESMLYVRERGDSSDIFLASPAGDAIRRLAGNGARNGAPVFAPDSRRIAYHADYGKRSDIVVVDRWGLKREVVVAEGVNHRPRWSPDGRWLVYTAVGPGGDTDIRAVSIDGGEPVTIATSPGNERDASWRPLQ